MSEPDRTTDAARAALLRACDLLGGQAAMAEALGIEDRRTVWPWMNLAGRRVPQEYCPDLERLTYAVGQPVLCEALRPDLRWVRVTDPNWPHGQGRPCVDVARQVKQAA